MHAPVEMARIKHCERHQQDDQSRQHGVYEDQHRHGAAKLEQANGKVFGAMVE